MGRLKVDDAFQKRWKIKGLIWSVDKTLSRCLYIVSLVLIQLTGNNKKIVCNNQLLKLQQTVI